MNPAPPPASPASPGSARSFVSWMVLERVLRGAVNMIVLAFVARHLAPAGFGALNVAIAVVTLVMPLAQLGLDTIAIRMLIREPHLAGAILGTCALLRAAAGVAVAVVLLVWASGTTTAVAFELLLPVALLLVLQAAETTELWFRRWVRATPTAVARTVATVISAAIKLSLVARGADVVMFAWVHALEAAGFVTVLALAYRRITPTGPRPRWDGGVATRLVRQGWGFTASAFIAGAAFRIDQLAVSHYFGDAAAGTYFAAVRLLEIPFFAASALAMALHPALVESQVDPVRHRERLRFSFEALTVLGLLSALGFTLLGSGLVKLVVGVEFAAAAPLAMIYSWGQVTVFTGLIRLQWMTIHPAPGTQLVQSALALLLQFVAVFTLVPRWGATGAAVASALSFTASGWLLPLLLPAMRPMVAPQAQALLILVRPTRWRNLLSLFAGNQSNPSP